MNTSSGPKLHLNTLIDHLAKDFWEGGSSEEKCVAAIALNYARVTWIRWRPRVRATNIAIINGSQHQLPSFSNKVCKGMKGAGGTFFGEKAGQGFL